MMLRIIGHMPIQFARDSQKEHPKKRKPIQVPPCFDLIVCNSSLASAPIHQSNNDDSSDVSDAHTTVIP